MSSNKPHRVWIELERPTSGLSPSLLTAEANSRAALATSLLRRLGDQVTEFWWDEKNGVDCVTTSTSGAYLECPDNGHWFNLERLAVRERA